MNVTRGATRATPMATPQMCDVYRWKRRALRRGKTCPLRTIAGHRPSQLKCHYLASRRFPSRWFLTAWPLSIANCGTVVGGRLLTWRAGGFRKQAHCLAALHGALRHCGRGAFTTGHRPSQRECHDMASRWFPQSGSLRGRSPWCTAALRPGGV